MAGRDRRSLDDEFDREVDRGVAAAADDGYGEDAFDEEAFDDGESTDRASQRGASPATAARRASSASTRSRPVARPRAKEKDELGPGLFGRIKTFVREVVAELQKVIWPTRKELLTYTVVVIVFVSIIMTFVALLDLGFAKVMFLVFGGESTK